MPVADLLIHAPRAVVDGSETSCVVAVAGGRVVAVDEGREDGGFGGDAAAFVVTEAEVVRLGDDVVLLPGMVDAHVHVNEPGRTDWEGFAHATRAAAAGGVTTIVDMPLNSTPVTVDVRSLEAKRAAADGQCVVDVAFWGGAVPANGEHLHRLWDAGVLGFKCFLAESGIPDFAPLDTEGLRAVMERVASFDGLLLVHAEDPAALGDCDPTSTSYADFLGSRPDSSELTAVQEVVEVARRTGCRVHVVHLAAARALPVLTSAQEAGLCVTAETCPHYLTFSADDVPAGGTVFKCCPPIRDTADRDALWEALADGTIALVASDHSPCTPDLKALSSGRFAEAWGGISSLQLSLPVVWTEARRRGHELTDVVGWMSTAPADLVGLRRKGRIAVGADADFCVVAPEERFAVVPELLEHRNPLTPYAGRELFGVVRETWLAGRRVDVHGEPRGRLLRRGGDR